MSNVSVPSRTAPLRRHRKRGEEHWRRLDTSDGVTSSDLLLLHLLFQEVVHRVVTGPV
jgi:hypothetical protein